MSRRVNLREITDKLFIISEGKKLKENILEIIEKEDADLKLVHRTHPKLIQLVL